ncbi:MAG: hypothetical protein LBE91_18305 [Tannerella sp.]|jgi:hypothetical protein|nr:hypothetical protein [Tannerella sp.]
MKPQFNILKRIIFIPFLQAVFLSLSAEEPPSALTLSVDGAGTNLHSAVIKWAAPSNGGANSEGQAATYDVRYSSNPITEENFNACEKADVTIAPKPVGNMETLYVNELETDTRFEYRGGVMRNNIVKNTEIVLRSTTDFKIYDNTVWSTDKYPYASICLRVANTGNFDIGAYQTASDETPELDSELISVSVNGEAYTHGNNPVTLLTGQVFNFIVAMKNTGTETWGQFLERGERGASFLSRDPDYNDTFGIPFISPNQGQLVSSGETFEYDTWLQAPAEPGDYTMTWQMADWIIPTETITKPNRSTETRLQ